MHLGHRAWVQKRQLELESIASRGASVDVESGKAPRGARQASGSIGGPISLAERFHEQDAEASNDLVGKGDEVPAIALELIQQPNALQRGAAGQVVDEAIDRFEIGKAKQIADSVCVDRVGTTRDDLVEHRLGVAHPAGGALRDQIKSLIRDRPTFRLGDAPKLASYL